MDREEYSGFRGLPSTPATDLLRTKTGPVIEDMWRSFVGNEAFLGAATGFGGTGAVPGAISKNLGPLIRTAKASPEKLPELLKAAEGILRNVTRGMSSSHPGWNDISQIFARRVGQRLAKMDPEFGANSLAQAAKSAFSEYKTLMSGTSREERSFIGRAQAAEEKFRAELAMAGQDVPQNASPFANSWQALARRMGATTPIEQQRVRDYLDKGASSTLRLDQRTKEGRTFRANLPDTTEAAPDVVAGLRERIAKAKAEPAFSDPLLAKLDLYLTEGAAAGLKPSLRTFASQLTTMRPEQLAELGLQRPISAQALHQRYSLAKSKKVAATGETSPISGSSDAWITKTGEIEDLPKGFERLANPRTDPATMATGSWINGLLNLFLRENRLGNVPPRSTPNRAMQRQLNAPQQGGPTPDELFWALRRSANDLGETGVIPGMPLLSPNSTAVHPFGSPTPLGFEACPIMSIKGDEGLR